MSVEDMNSGALIAAARIGLVLFTEFTGRKNKEMTTATGLFFLLRLDLSHFKCQPDPDGH